MPDPCRSSFPFVVGVWRSGTTLLRLMLDAHPIMSIPTESYFPLDPPPPARRPGDRVDAGAVLATFEEHAWFRRWDLPRSAATDALPVGLQVSYADAIRLLYRTYARAQGKERYGNKTPRHVGVISELSHLFPEARFVHIVRDGRDVALSVMEVEFGPSDLETAARSWRRQVERAQSAGRALGPSRYRVVRYEDLVDQPERSLSDLCSFIGLDFDPVMLDYPARADRVLALVRRPEKHRHLQDRPRRTRDWRRQLSPEQASMFEAIAGSTLEDLGYERRGTTSSMRAAMAVRGMRWSVSAARLRRARERARASRGTL